MYTIEYTGFLQAIKREFKTKKLAIYWLRSVGKSGLIKTIQKKGDTKPW